VYATALNTFEHLAGRLIADAGLGEPPTPARADRISTDALAPIKRDLDTIGLIGSQDTVVLTNQVVADFEILAARMCHQARWGDEPMGGPQRRAHQTAEQDLGTPCAISYRSRIHP
jgi:hypothetical protein